MGSRPDGWWRDRAGAAARLLREIAPLSGGDVTTPDGVRLQVARLVAVVEGRARQVAAPEGVEAVRAAADGDARSSRVAEEAAAAGDWCSSSPRTGAASPPARLGARRGSPLVARLTGTIHSRPTRTAITALPLSWHLAVAYGPWGARPGHAGRGGDAVGAHEHRLSAPSTAS